ncbi:MAG: flavin reductase [Eubacteriales bacterium]|nr:flavin reductase [Eubacteriales bacterium]
MKNIVENVFECGIYDKEASIFENQFPLLQGMSFNSYVIVDEKIVILDCVDKKYEEIWLKNIENIIKDKIPDYLILQHVEPDHSGALKKFIEKYKSTIIVGNEKTFEITKKLFDEDFESRRIVINDEDTLDIGNRKLHFYFAPMVHWPEVFMTYDEVDKIFFSADAFGKFGSNDILEPWDDEARRYYFGIVAKYGEQVKALFEKIKNLNIQIIAPLHGPVLKQNLDHYFNLYKIWSNYEKEEDGFLIVYTSVYNDTKEIVYYIKDLLEKNSIPKVEIFNLSFDEINKVVSECFKYKNIIFATTTYNNSIFPFMKDLLYRLVDKNFQNKNIFLIGNGLWSENAISEMKNILSSCNNLKFVSNLQIEGAMKEENKTQINTFAYNASEEYIAKDDSKANKNDNNAMYNIGYGLYIATSNDGKKDNGFVLNTAMQITSNPNQMVICINKNNYSYEIIKENKKVNINILTTDTPFDLIKQYGFQSGREVDKFKNVKINRTSNGLVYLNDYINSVISLNIIYYKDLSTHGMFIGEVVESRVFNNFKSLTYDYYQKNIKPKRANVKKKGWICKICGYIYEGDELPKDFICPICKHGAIDFERIV